MTAGFCGALSANHCAKLGFGTNAGPGVAGEFFALRDRVDQGHSAVCGNAMMSERTDETAETLEFEIDESSPEDLAIRGAQLLADSQASHVNPTIHVVDDDDEMCCVMVGMIRRTGLNVVAYTSANEFLNQYAPGSPGCLITDLRMPGIDGLSLVRRLKEASATLPVIVVTGSGDIQAAVQAMRLSAVDVLLKPFDSDLLCTRVRQSLELDATRREDMYRRTAARRLLERLSDREREMLQFIVDGMDNRQIALRTQTSERAIEAHRARIAKKLLARNDFDIARVTIVGNAADV
jgi:two-component system, LuxR family, response regulator FixJ